MALFNGLKCKNLRYTSGGYGHYIVVRAIIVLLNVCYRSASLTVISMLQYPWYMLLN